MGVLMRVALLALVAHAAGNDVDALFETSFEKAECENSELASGVLKDLLKVHNKTLTKGVSSYTYTCFSASASASGRAARALNDRNGASFSVVAPVATKSGEEISKTIGDLAKTLLDEMKADLVTVTQAALGPENTWGTTTGEEAPASCPVDNSQMAQMVATAWGTESSANKKCAAFQCDEGYEKDYKNPTVCVKASTTDAAECLIASDCPYKNETCGTDDKCQRPKPAVVVDNDDDGLSGGAIAGIVVGSVAFVLLLVGIGFARTRG